MPTKMKRCEGNLSAKLPSWSGKNWKPCAAVPRVRAVWRRRMVSRDALYYELLMQAKTGTDQTIMELASELENFLIQKLQRMQALAQQDPNLLEKLEAVEFPTVDATELLAEFEKKMTEVVPEIPSIRYTVSFLDASIASENTIAYYLIPPLDQETENIMKVNPAYADKAERCGLRWRTKAFRDIVTNITIFRIPILIQSAVSFRKLPTRKAGRKSSRWKLTAGWASTMKI